VIIRHLDARALGVDAVVASLERPASQTPAGVSAAVDEILAAVRARGDVALLEYTERFDGFRAAAGRSRARRSPPPPARWMGPRGPLSITLPSGSSAITRRRCRSRGG
jgi:hypothetical protein